MQQDTSIQIHPSELKHFLRHVCMASKGHKEGEKAREKPDRQVRKIKKISLEKNIKKENFEKELEQLSEKIKLGSNKEGKLLKHIHVEEDTLRYLTKKIKTLESDISATKRGSKKGKINKEKIKKFTNTINQIRSKIDQLIKAKRYKEDRINELEKKIKKSKVRRLSP